LLKKNLEKQYFFSKYRFFLAKFCLKKKHWTWTRRFVKLARKSVLVMLANIVLISTESCKTNFRIIIIPCVTVGGWVQDPGQCCQQEEVTLRGCVLHGLQASTDILEKSPPCNLAGTNNFLYFEQGNFSKSENARYKGDFRGYQLIECEKHSIFHSCSRNRQVNGDQRKCFANYDSLFYSMGHHHDLLIAASICISWMITKSKFRMHPI